jgi:hypothetical protein
MPDTYADIFGGAPHKAGRKRQAIIKEGLSVKEAALRVADRAAIAIDRQERRAVSWLKRHAKRRP